MTTQDTVASWLEAQEAALIELGFVRVTPSEWRLPVFSSTVNVRLLPDGRWSEGTRPVCVATTVHNGLADRVVRFTVEEAMDALFELQDELRELWILDLAHWTERRDELIAMREKHVDSTSDGE